MELDKVFIFDLDRDVGFGLTLLFNLQLFIDFDLVI